VERTCKHRREAGSSTLVITESNKRAAGSGGPAKEQRLAPRQSSSGSPQVHAHQISTKPDCRWCLDTHVTFRPATASPPPPTPKRTREKCLWRAGVDARQTPVVGRRFWRIANRPVGLRGLKGAATQQRIWKRAIANTTRHGRAHGPVSCEVRAEGGRPHM
jgi:hypothetical protein